MDSMTPNNNVIKNIINAINDGGGFIAYLLGSMNAIIKTGKNLSAAPDNFLANSLAYHNQYMLSGLTNSYDTCPVTSEFIISESIKLKYVR